MKNIMQVFLFLSHLSSDEIIKEFKNIRRSIESMSENAGENTGQAFFLYDATRKIVPDGINKLSPYLYSDECLSSLGYPTIGRTIIPGHAHFPLFKFFLDKPDYDYYWVIEYDVRFAGDWRLFFDSFIKTNADFLSCHIRSNSDEPFWPWWKLNHPREYIPLKDRLRSFNPIYRLSNPALSFLHTAFKNGWCGHHEVAIPTLLQHHGFTIRELSGESRYTVSGMENKFYSNSESNPGGMLSCKTMRYRPAFWRWGRESNKLYHPVKPLKPALHDNLLYYKDLWKYTRGYFTSCGGMLFKKNARKSLTPQRQLSYFLLNILDHCNLRCKGCDHFAAIAEKRFVSLENIKKDLARMSKILNGGIPIIGIMGGEPLLHPQLKEILFYARFFFPKTVLRLVTNGLLLPKQDEDFWRTCREQKILIVNTKYPVNLDHDAIKKIAAAQNVMFEYYEDTGDIIKTSYKIPLDIEGSQDPRKSFIKCFHANALPLLMEGKLYACTVAPNVRHFNKRFGTHLELEDSDSLDIHHVNNASEIINFLCSPKPFCRYCDVNNRSYGHKWERSKFEIGEWVT
ncbi:MAG TPA: radical SAM protein [Smithella sp.]|nr:radical SAM protein [Smithella sp.]